MSTSAREPIRIGVIGVGTLSLRGILPHLSQSDVADRVTIAALADPVIDRARAAADQYGATPFASVD